MDYPHSKYLAPKTVSRSIPTGDYMSDFLKRTPYLVTGVHLKGFVVVSAEDTEVHVRLAKMADQGN